MEWGEQPEAKIILVSILEPIALLHDLPRLREIVIELKQSDGEHRAIGEMLERACNILDVELLPFFAIPLDGQTLRELRKG